MGGNVTHEFRSRHVNRFLPAALTALLLLGLAGCSKQDTTDQAEKASGSQAPAEAQAPTETQNPAQVQLPPGHPPPGGMPRNDPPMIGQPPAPGVATSIGGANSGVVQSVQQAGGYTYIEVESDGRTRWLASSPVRVEPGDAVRWGESAVMRNFTSKSLGRTFDELLFVSNVQPAGGGVRDLTSNAGKVVSLTRAAGYAYLEVQTDEGTKWLAASQAPVEVGDTVTWQGGSVMNNFTSTSLNRTFDQIIFVAAVSPAG